ncbi:hypothetical protein BaRGS_00017556 [Batillaria attramentaria]|uniref:Aminoglycoside phosphotransferase domain-containing protein n=1 Tax=Batillaria attramentaria TaxID=370345 RepID=A0ABD0KVT0_9CAEN
MADPSPNDSDRVLTPAWVQTVLLECLREDGSVQELQFATEKTELRIENLSDGHLNFVVRVAPKSDLSKSLILKYAAPYIKILGPNFPLSPDRGRLEFRALVKYNAICPGCVPKPLAYNLAHSAFCMEDLRDYSVYRKWLLAGNVDEDVARKLARALGLIHHHTHVTTIGQAAIRQLDRDFQNPDIINVTDTYFFNNALTPNMPTNHWSPLLNDEVEAMQTDDELLRVTKHMQRLFHEKKEALIHGDMHTGSTMVKVDEYLKHMTASIGVREQYIERLMSETAGFAGCEMVRRLLGAGRVEDMDSLEIAQPDALSAGCRLLRAQHRVRDIQTMMSVVLSDS